MRKIPIFDLSVGMEILIDRRYTSFIVGFVQDTQSDNSDEPEKLVVFKDWDPHKKTWNYHVMREWFLSYSMDIYKREFLSDMKVPITKEEMKRKRQLALDGPNKKKVVLDYEYIKNLLSKYKIIKYED